MNKEYKQQERELIEIRVRNYIKYHNSHYSEKEVQEEVDALLHFLYNYFTIKLKDE